MFFDEIEVTNKNDYIYIFSDLILFIMPETPEKLTDEATTLKEDVKDKGDDKKDEVEEKVSRDDMEEELDYEPAKVEYSLYSPPPLTLLNRPKNLFFYPRTS